MSEQRYAMFLGCLIPYREVGYEVSARRVAKELGIKLEEMLDANCCGVPFDDVNHEMMLALAARDLCIAEDMGLNIVTLCSGCSGVLTKVNKKLKQDRALRERVNGYLKEIGMEFKGKIEVKHFVRVLIEDVGYEKLEGFIKKLFRDLKVAEHYGCHILRPQKYLELEDPENPTFLRRLIEITGAKTVDYLDKKQCCGLPVVGIDERMSLQLAKNKLEHIKEVGADAIVTICPFCHVAYDANQLRIEKVFSESYGIPVLHYPQLLGLAMGINPNELALDKLRVKSDNIIRNLEIS
ncbi:MAG: CoB--CoM heterodisulfide reductase iron-sulfur subunit B family protein [Candidatus Bathyarchaeota archaeon]|nr:CoB--CoM heterodisulfide reductase iron-sulfur subunit B family protein [Candidatus Bathyarchaeota archaeon]